MSYPSQGLGEFPDQPEGRREMEPRPGASEPTRSLEREFFDRLSIDPRRLAETAARASADYRSAAPFPHVVIDGLFDPFVLDRALEEFPGPDGIDWIRFDTPHERKLATRDEAQIGWLTRTLIGYLNSSTFLSFVEDVTGIRGLIPDPHLDGGGLHQIPAGGKLGIHSDFLTQQRLKLDRRINLILYLNRDWPESYGGHLELWDREIRTCEKRILPIYNRLVLFNTTSTAYHGHPEALTCPPDRTRRSIALYYYSNGRPAEELGGVKPTRFLPRPNEKVVWRMRQLIAKFVPPIVNELRYKLRR